MVNFTSKTYQMKRERPAGYPPPVGFASFYRTITELRKILLFLCRSFPDSPVEIFPGNKIPLMVAPHNRNIRQSNGLPFYSFLS